LIDGLSCCTGSGAKMGLRSACRFNGGVIQNIDALGKLRGGRE
jgi:hypothetical protein